MLILYSLEMKIQRDPLIRLIAIFTSIGNVQISVNTFKEKLTFYDNFHKQMRMGRKML
jgi:hypothetical protein